MVEFKTLIMTCAWVLSWLSLNSGQLPAQDAVEQLEEQAIRQAVAGIKNSVVRLETIGGNSRVDGQIVSRAAATGLVVTKDGYALSASFHFANQPASIFAQLPDGRKAVAEIIGRDRSRKIVLLKIQSDFEFFIPDMATTRDIRVGQTVIAVGRVFDPDSPNVSTGIISAKNRIWDRAMQTDAKISPANFGGPLIDLHGKVRGILVPMDPDNENEMAGTQWYDSGIGFAVPIADILGRFEDLKNGKELRPGRIGISLRGNDVFADRAVVAFCQGSSPAGIAGIRPGDEIIEVNNRAISRQSELKHALGPMYADDVANVTILRNGKRLAVEIRLAGDIEPFIPPAAGLILRRDVNHKMIVATVLENRPAQLAGIEPGDRILKFNGNDVKDNETLRLAVAGSEIGSNINVTIERNGVSKDVVLTMKKMESSLPAKSVLTGPVPLLADVMQIKIADVPNSCYAIVPEQKPGNEAPALLVWIPEPGKLNKEKIEQDWLDHCRKHNVVLLVPESTAEDRWSPGEIEFVTDAVDNLVKQIPLDRNRITIGGAKTGGAMASLLVSSRRDLFRGLILINTGLSERMGRLATSPVEPLLVLIGTDDQSGSLTKTSSEKLQNAYIPFHVEQRNDRAGIAAWIVDILKWANAVDRL